MADASADKPPEGAHATTRQRDHSSSPEAGTPLPVVFHVRHFGVGGVEAALLGWLRGLDRRRFTPSLSIFLPTREWEEIWRARIPNDVAVTVAVPADAAVAHLHQARRDNRLGRLGRAWLSVKLKLAQRRWLAPHLRQLQAQNALLVDFDHTLRKQLSALRIPAIAVRHFAFWNTRNAKARRVGRDLAAYQRVLVLNDDMRRQAEALYGASGALAPRCVTVPSLFDIEAIRTAGREPLSALQGIDPAAAWAVCVARIDIPTKGLDTLLEAWQRLIQRVPDARLIIVGGGNDELALQREVHRCQLQHHVQLLGMQTNPQPWIARARLLVSASRSEGASNVIVEALIHGTPVVATDCRVGPRDILQDGHCGALVPVDDVASLVAALERGWEDAEWRTEMRRRGLERAEDFGRERGNERLAAVVDDVRQSSRLTTRS